MEKGGTHMTSMTRGLLVPRRAVLAATTRGDVAHSAPVIATVGRPATEFEPGERRAVAREHAWVEAAASAAIRGPRT
jgi:hypothetical protein